MIPFKLNNDWNLITRTIVPLTDVVHIVPGNPVGVGDTVSIIGGVSQIVKIGAQPLSVGVLGKYYAVRPDGAPAWGLRFVVTLLFPK